MSDEQTSQSGQPCDIATSAIAPGVEVSSVPANSVEPAAVEEGQVPFDPRAPLPVTHASLLVELVGAVKKCARGVSHEIEDLIAKAEKHFGL